MTQTYRDGWDRSRTSAWSWTSAWGLVVALLWLGTGLSQVLAAERGLDLVDEFGVEPSFERWYVIRLMDQPAGHAHAREFELPDGRWLTTVDMRITVGRAGMNLEVSQRLRTLEDAQGVPLRAQAFEVMGALEKRTDTWIRDGFFETTVSQAGARQQSRRPVPAGEFLAPAAAGRQVEAAMKAGEQTIGVRVFSPDLRVSEQVMTRRGEEVIEVIGKSVAATAWEVVDSSLPGLKLTQYLDDQGDALLFTLPLMPGMEFRVVAAPRALALQKVDPVEMVASMLVQPDRPVAAPRQSRRAVYEVRLVGGASPSEEAAAGGTEVFPLGALGYQVTEAMGPGHYRVTVDLDGPPDAAVNPGSAYLESSGMLNLADPAVQAVLAEALAMAGEQPAFDRALALRQFTEDFIQTKDLSVGFATASEVVRTRRGDCTEHAVLLAALLRGAEIPSRVVTGLVYVDAFGGASEIFGYHMWTQAWVAPAPGESPRWVDLDAAVPPVAGLPGFDAAHIALSESRLDDVTLSEDLVRLVPLFGRLEIRVIEP